MTLDKNDNITTPWEWEKYWKSGRIASCFDDNQEGYLGAIARHWTDFFSASTAGDNVLDLGCGNGAISVLALKAQPDLNAYGVDMAAIDPAKTAPGANDILAKVHFSGAVDMRALPFDDGYFQAISSQFAIEYAPLDAVITEAARVLAPKGRFCAVLHAKNGYAWTAQQDELADIAFLENTVRLIPITRSAITHVCKAERAGAALDAQTDANARAAAKALNEALMETTRRTLSHTHPFMLKSVVDTIAKTYHARSHYDAPPLLAKIDEVEDEIRAHKLRSAALVDAALDEDGIAALCKEMQQNGLEPQQPKRLNDDSLGGFLGWAVQATKGA